MNLKKVKLISVISIFLLSFFFHQLYEWLPNTILAFLLPVNESIWEHLKLIFFTITCWSLFESLLLKNVKHNNFLLATLINALTTTIIFTIIYLPIYKLIGYNHFITLLIYFITLIIGQYISYYILNMNTTYSKLNKIAPLLILLIIIIFGYLSFKPLKIPLFYDEYQNKYGIYNCYKVIE